MWTGKRNRCGFVFMVLFTVSFILGHLVSDFTSGAHTTAEIGHRGKRSLICLFGLTSVLREAVYLALSDVHEFDPLELGDVDDCELEDGVLKGLSRLKNLTAIEVFCDDNQLIIFATTLGMRDAEIKYQWTRQYLFTFQGTIWMKAREVHFELEVQLNTTGGLTFKVTNSLLTRMDEFEAGFTGLGPLNPMVKGIMNLMYMIWRGRATAEIENIIKEGLEKKLAEISHTIDFLMNF